MADPPDQTPEASLLAIRQHATAVADGRSEPYAAGREMWTLAMDGTAGESPASEDCRGLWLIWGALTDWVENKPDERAQADAAMKRAAIEWIKSQHSETARRAYLDRWIYDELEYERPRLAP